LKPDVFKKVVSGEPIDARMPYGKPFILRNYARIAVNANELPFNIELTDAFFRRLLIIPFSVKIRSDERDPTLARNIVEQEAAGVINWILAGLGRVIAQYGFTPNEEAQKAIDEYRLEADSVALFMHERHFVKSLTNQVPLGELHAAYRIYCETNLYRPVSSRRMSQRLRDIGYETKKKNSGIHVYANRLSNDSEDGSGKFSF
jgi:putative DNA primase/helicase